MDGWTKNSLKCTTSHSGEDTGEMVIFGERTVYIKGMGGKYTGIRWKDTFRFFNISKSKKFQNYFSGSKDFILIQNSHHI